MALNIEKKTYRSKYYELQVLAKLSEFKDSNLSLHEFPDRFMRSIKEIPRKSAGFAEDFYKATLTKDYKKVEIWHLDKESNPDRLLAVVTDDGKKNNPFNF